MRDEQPWDKEARNEDEGQPLHERADDGRLKAWKNALIDRAHRDGNDKVRDTKEVPGHEERVANKAAVRGQVQNDPGSEDAGGEISETGWYAKLASRRCSQ